MMLQMAQNHGGMDYQSYHLAGSRLSLRGPQRHLARDYWVALGGVVTFGRFIAQPWSDVLEGAARRQVINLGVAQAGPDAYLNDPPLLALAQGAQLRIIEVTGACNLSNPLWTVHPRRNDRVLRVSPLLSRLYPEVDFMNVIFTGHMMATLAHHDSARFAQVVRILQDCWHERMIQLLQQLQGPSLLLVLSEGALGLPPLLDPAMIEGLRPFAQGVVHVPMTEALGALAGKTFPPHEVAMARQLPGSLTHLQIAQALQGHLQST